MMGIRFTNSNPHNELINKNKEKALEPIRIKTSALDPQIRFRIPRELRALLKQAALINGRSLSAEILYRVTRGLVIN
jgi:hypothetical protein